MKITALSTLLLLSSIALLGACSGETSPETGNQASDPAAVGSDRDEHGCIGSAGYRWCEAENECKRPWELAEEKGFDPTPEAFDEYCGNATE